MDIARVRIGAYRAAIPPDNSSEIYTRLVIENGRERWGVFRLTDWADGSVRRVRSDKGFYLGGADNGL